MTGRYGTALGVAVLASGLTMSVVTPNAQEKKAPAKWVLERTPDGKPDLQGVWANNTVTPLQRPKQWEGKATLTDAEVAELQRIAQQIVRQRRRRAVR